jgi:ribose-phosphate pyrophosphokinase
MKLFGIGTTRPLAERIGGCLQIRLAEHEEREFEDGEFKIRSLETVSGERVFVVHSLAGEKGHSVNDKLCRLLVFIGALKDAGAREVTAVLPYLAFWRKDQRTQSRDPVTTRYVARLLEAVGVDAVVAVDAHNPISFDNAFDCRKDHLTAISLFAAHFQQVLGECKKLVVVSPDAGGVKRARAFAAELAERIGRGVDVAFGEKHRSRGRVTGDLFAGDVDGATVIVVDDLVSGGTTIARAAAACRLHGARSVHAAATHGVFAAQSAVVLGGASLASLVVTDTVADVRRRCADLTIEVEVLETAPLLARAIERWL